MIKKLTILAALLLVGLLAGCSEQEHSLRSQPDTTSEVAAILPTGQTSDELTEDESTWRLSAQNGNARRVFVDSVMTVPITIIGKPFAVRYNEVPNARKKLGDTCRELNYTARAANMSLKSVEIRLGARSKDGHLDAIFAAQHEEAERKALIGDPRFCPVLIIVILDYAKNVEHTYSTFGNWQTDDLFPAVACLEQIGQKTKNSYFEHIARGRRQELMFNGLFSGH